MVPNPAALSVLVVGVVAVAACTSLRRVQPVEFLATNSPDVLWVTYANKRVVPVTQPEIAGDTIKGMWAGTQRRVAIPLREVQLVHARLPDRTKTALLLATLGAGAVSAVYFIWISKAGPMQGFSCGFDQRGFPIPYC